VGWAIQLLAGIISIITLVLSKPDKKILAYVCAFMIGVSMFLNVYRELSTERTAYGIQYLAYEKLSSHTHRFLNIISTMIEVASDGWLPSNKNEFFSKRSIDLICN
jgi:hypothetical protein